MLGTYSYKNGQPKRFRYHDALANQDFFFQVSPVNVNIAAVQFFNNNTFTVQIPIPPNFTMHDGAGPVMAFMNTFFVAWIDNYTLSYNGAHVWKLYNQKQQAMQKCTNDLDAIQ
jgi:hypothetical protein